MDNNNYLKYIEQYGWAVMLVEKTNYLPSFAYTIGLWRNYKHPELISFGLSIATLHDIINVAAEMVAKGQTLVAQKQYNDFFENGFSQFIKVDEQNIGDYLGYAIDFYQTKKIPVLQLVWTDRNNKFPWETDYEQTFIYRQPLLDRNVDFKFREAPNTTTFTTKQWLEQNKPILTVVHDYDGNWQFLTNDQLSTDARIVALQELIQRDKTLNEVFNLDYGEKAERTSIGCNWIRSVIEDK